METVVNYIAAYNQAGWIAAGLIMLVIGGLLLAGHLYYRFSAMRVQAQIKAVRVEGNPNVSAETKHSGACYYPVYEYKNPDGVLIKAESNSGSSFLHNKEPGKVVYILVLPYRPFQALEEGNGLLLISLFFIAMAMGLLLIAFNSFKTSSMTFVFLGGLIMYEISRYVSKINPPASSLREWQQKRAKEFAEKRSKLRLLTTDEYVKLVRNQDLMFKKWIPLYLLLGILLLGISYHLSKDTQNMLMNGITLSGEVVGLHTNFNSSGKTLYHNIVRFKTKEGTAFQFTDKISSSIPMDNNKQAVTVIYEPKNPRNAIIDRGLWNWMPTALMLIPGLLILWLSCRSYLRINRRLSIKRCTNYS
jgi:hypothetical protein